MAKKYQKPTAKQVELSVEKVARAARRAAKTLGQYNGTIDIEPSERQKAAWAKAAANLRSNRKKS